MFQVGTIKPLRVDITNITCIVCTRRDQLDGYPVEIEGRTVAFVNACPDHKEIVGKDMLVSEHLKVQADNAKRLGHVKRPSINM